ncbi:hypothetical protein P7K49_036957, partial [Saguinus oedipus]
GCHALVAESTSVHFRHEPLPCRHCLPQQSTPHLGKSKHLPSAKEGPETNGSASLTTHYTENPTVCKPQPSQGVHAQVWGLNASLFHQAVLQVTPPQHQVSNASDLGTFSGVCMTVRSCAGSRGGNLACVTSDNAAGRALTGYE